MTGLGRRADEKKHHQAMVCAVGAALRLAAAASSQRLIRSGLRRTGMTGTVDKMNAMTWRYAMLMKRQMLSGVFGMVLGPALLGLVLATPAHGQCPIQQFGKPGSVGEDDLFGAVSADGDLLLVADSLADESVGAVYVFRRDGFTWSFETELHSPEPDPDPDHKFYVADVSGDVIVVGDAKAVDYQGAAYVFRRDPDTGEWEYEARLTASDGEPGDDFGYSVAVDGDVVVVGARLDSQEGLVYCGSGYAFRRIDGQWQQEAKLTPPDPGEWDLMGVSADVLGDVAIVGAYVRDTGSVSLGSALVFRYDGEKWALDAELISIDLPGTPYYFGADVALGQNVAVIGSPNDDSQDGAVHIFRYDGAQWHPEAKLSGSDPVGPWAQLGWYVAINEDGTTILAGAPYDRAMGYDAGAAYLFRNEGPGWEEITKLLPTEPVVGTFGWTTIADDIGFVGAPGYGVHDPGRVHVFAGLDGIDCNDNGVPDACDIFDGTSEDINGNGIPDECETIGDLDGDGAVDVQDLLMLLSAWGPCDPPCPPACVEDVNGDCAVDVWDLLLLLANWSTQAVEAVDCACNGARRATKRDRYGFWPVRCPDDIARM